MATMYLTDRLVKTIEAPVGRAEVWDTVVPGLGLRYSGRQKTWFYVYHSPESLDSRGRRRRRRLTLGSYPKVSLAEARGQAAEFRERIRLGHDPADLHESADVEGLRFRELAERYFQAEAKSPTQKRRYTWALQSLLPVFGDRFVVTIKRSEIVEYLGRVRERGPSVATLQLASLRRILQWGALQYDLSGNPARGIVLEPIPPRERVLTTSEVRGLWWACQQSASKRMSVLLRLRLVTAQRGAQLLRLNLNQLERDAAGLWWNIPSGITKTGKPNRLFLSPLAEELLASARPSADGWVFGQPPPTYSHLRGDRLTSLRRLVPGDWRSMDLRRTAATWMAQRGVPRFIVKRVLGHADGDITAVYDRYGYDREVKAAVLILEQAIREAIGESPPAVPIVEPVTFPLSGPSPFFPQFPGLPR